MTKTPTKPGKETKTPAKSIGPGTKPPPKTTKTNESTKPLEKPKNPVGSPPKFRTPEDMQPLIDNYFETCDKGRTEERYNKRNEVETATIKIPYTISGLAYHLGFAERQTLWDYGQKEKFRDTIRRAKLKIERQRWEQSLSGSVDARMAQFDFVNNFGYVYQPDVQISGPMPSITIIMGSGERMSISGSNPGQKQITDIPDAEVIEHETDGED